VLRIGVALGDVVVEGGDLYGDPVNIAARLEALAEPGGILVSEAIACQAHGRVACTLEDVGPLRLKNLPHPVQGFRIRREASPGIAQAPREQPSVAVLPFANLGGGPEEDWFADGITEELTTALARVRWFHVIARNSAFAYKGRAVDVRQVGRELGVGYVLEGSIRRAGGRIRITGQLVEAETGRHIWADRFEGAAEEVFALQDAVAEAVAGAMEPSLGRAEVERVRSRPTASLNAFELCLRSVSLRLRMTHEDSNAAMALLRRALELDPAYGTAKANLLYCVMHRIGQGWAGPDEREEGARVAREAFATHGDDPLTLANVATALCFLAFDLDVGLEAATRAVGLNPNSAYAQHAAGWVHTMIGEPEIAIAHFQRAIRLSPHDSELGVFHAGLGFAHLAAGRPQAALDFGEKALRQMPILVSGHRVVIAALFELGRAEEAAAAARRYLRIVPGATASGHYRRVYRDQAFVERLIRAFRAAGLPE
jgi:adenylate cyclase